MNTFLSIIEQIVISVITAVCTFSQLSCKLRGIKKYFVLLFADTRTSHSFIFCVCAQSPQCHTREECVNHIRLFKKKKVFLSFAQA